MYGTTRADCTPYVYKKKAAAEAAANVTACHASIFLHDVLEPSLHIEPSFLAIDI